MSNDKWYHVYEIWKGQASQDLSVLKEDPISLIVPLHAIGQMADAALRHILVISGQSLFDEDSYKPSPADVNRIFPLDKDVSLLMQHWGTILEWQQCTTESMIEYIDIKISIAENIRDSIRNIMNMFEDYRVNGGWSGIDNKVSSLLKQAEGGAK